MAAGDLWLAGATPDDIYRSTDGGVTWDSSGIGAPAGQTAVSGIAVAPNGDIWLAGATPDDIYRSTDDGVTWDSSGIGAPAGQTAVRGIAVAPNGDIWLAGSTPDDIYRSTDGGATWDSSGIGAPAGQTIVSGIAVAPNGDILLTGGLPNDIYRSTDGGATWDSSGIGAPAGSTFVSGIAVAPNGDIWLAGINPDDIYRSTDGGATWDSSGIGAPAGQTNVTGIAFDPRIAPTFSDDTGDDQDWTQNTAIVATPIPRSSGVPAPTYASVGDEPAGIDIVLPTETADGSITGTPTAVGSGTVTIRATNSEGSDDWTIDFTTVADVEAPSFADNTGDAISGTVGTAITSIIVPEADGNPDPTYAVVGTLPSGLAFDTATRVLSGTPTAAGSGTITIRATNSEGTADWTVAYTFAPDVEAPAFADNTGDAVEWFTGIEIATFVVPAASGTPAPTYAVVGTLPGGIGFDLATRQISGTPTAARTGTIRIRATNSEGTADWTIAYTTINPLVLADSDDEGLEVDAKALLVASDAGTAGNFIYEDADRGGTDTPLDGELGLGIGNTVISGIRRRTATLLQLNDNNNPAALDIGDYFSAGGAGEDLTIYLQTMADGEVSFPASDVNFSRVDQVRFTIAADAQTLLDNLVSGDRLIFKTARPAAIPPLDAAGTLTGDLAGSIEGSASLGTAPALDATGALTGDLAGSIEGAASLGSSPHINATGELTGELSGSIAGEASLGSPPALDAAIGDLTGGLTGSIRGEASFPPLSVVDAAGELTGGLVGSIVGEGSLGALPALDATGALIGGLVGSIDGEPSLGVAPPLDAAIGTLTGGLVGSISGEASLVEALVAIGELTGGLTGSIAGQAAITSGNVPSRVFGVVARSRQGEVVFSLEFDDRAAESSSVQYRIDGGEWVNI